MRPRSWWSCARPKRSECSITITVASRHVDADFDDGGRDQQIDAAAGEALHRAVALFAFHLAVDEADAVAEMRFELVETFGRGFEIDQFRFFDERTDPIDFGAAIERALHRFDYLGQALDRHGQQS